MSFKDFSSSQQNKNGNKTSLAPKLAVVADQPQPDVAKPAEDTVPSAKR